MILFFLTDQLVVNTVGFVGQLFDSRVHGGVVLWVLAKGPVVLMPDVRPSDLVVEAVAFFVDLLLEMSFGWFDKLGFFLLLWLILRLLLVPVIQLVS